jgi:hypothetical protein
MKDIESHYYCLLIPYVPLNTQEIIEAVFNNHTTDAWVASFDRYTIGNVCL